LGHWQGEIPLTQPNADRPAKGYADRLLGGPGGNATSPTQPSYFPRRMELTPPQWDLAFSQVFLYVDKELADVLK
jgi:hypothetical protein